jgi:transcriptional regulator with XRE-family HTH domain
MANDPVDIQVGARMRMQRNLLGVSQSTLAERLGITFQQVQKYERGINRVSASKLQLIARAFGVPVAYFFDNGSSLQPNGRDGYLARPEKPGIDTEFLNLVRYYLKIENRELRQTMFTMIVSLGQGRE